MLYCHSSSHHKHLETAAAAIHNDVTSKEVYQETAAAPPADVPPQFDNNFRGQAKALSSHPFCHLAPRLVAPATQYDGNGNDSDVHNGHDSNNHNDKKISAVSLVFAIGVAARLCRRSSAMSPYMYTYIYIYIERERK